MTRLTRTEQMALIIEDMIEDYDGNYTDNLPMPIREIDCVCSCRATMNQGHYENCDLKKTNMEE